MSSQSTTTAGRTVQQVLDLNREAAVRLPAPDEEFTRGDVAPEVRGVFDKFISESIVHPVRRNGDHSNCFVWRTDRSAYQAAQELDSRDTLPCGHGGLRNLRDGGFACTEESCGAEFDRDTVAEVFGCEK